VVYKIEQVSSGMWVWKVQDWPMSAS